MEDPELESEACLPVLCSCRVLHLHGVALDQLWDTVPVLHLCFSKVPYLAPVLLLTFVSCFIQAFGFLHIFVQDLFPFPCLLFKEVPVQKG